MRALEYAATFFAGCCFTLAAMLVLLMVTLGYQSTTRPSPSVRIPQLLMTAESMVTIEPLSTPNGVITPKDARDSLFVDGNISPQLATGEQGKVSVIAVGRINIVESRQATLVPIAIRNNTASYVTRIEILAKARSSDGHLLASGDGQGIAPHLVQPGEVAFGDIYFGKGNLPQDVNVEFQIQFRTAGSALEAFDNVQDLEVMTAFRTEKRLVGLMRSQNIGAVKGPIFVGAACFDTSNHMLRNYYTFADVSDVSADGTIQYQIDLDGECPIFLVTGSGILQQSLISAEANNHSAP